MKARNYGELLSWYTKKNLLAYVEFGSYQGEYIAVIDNDKDIDLYKGYYGSCSGCDWLEAERNWDTNEIYDVEAEKYCKDEFQHPFASIPKETALRVDEETFVSFLPANVRGDIYDFDGTVLYQEIIKSIK